MLPAPISSTVFGDNQFFPGPTATFDGAGKNITSFSASLLKKNSLFYLKTTLDAIFHPSYILRLLHSQQYFNKELQTNKKGPQAIKKDAIINVAKETA